MSTTTVASHAPSARWALAGLSVPMLLSSLGTSIVNVGLPTLAHAFDASFGDVQWVVLAYLGAVTALIVGAGRLGDALGRRRVLLGGLVVFTAGSALAGAASHLAFLVAARAVQGVGAAVMMALTVALVGEAVPAGRTGRAMGLLGTMSAIGTALGPSLGGALIAAAGWRALFLVNVPVGLLALVLAARHLPADDGAGSIGRDAIGHTKLGRPRALRHPGLATALATSSLVAAVLMATLVVGPFYLSALGLQTTQVGLVMTVGPLVAAATGVPAGRLVDLFGTTRLTMLGLVGLGAGSVALSLLRPSAGVFGYVASIGVVTASYAIFQTANTTAVMAGMAAAERGAASGWLSLSRNLGLVGGASLMGAVFARSAGIDAGPEAAAAGLRAAFAVGSLLVGLALALAAGAAWPRTGDRPGRRARFRPAAPAARG